MSYPGSQQQFGPSDLQLLQQQLMLARLQELQKQQQHGHLSEGKPSSYLNNMSLFGKHSAGSQIPNLGSGMPFNASNIVSASNLNWMHDNVSHASSSMQGIISNPTYPNEDGQMTSPAMLQPSLYGAPVDGRRGNLGQYSSMYGASHIPVNMHFVNSDEKPTLQVPVFANSFFGDQQSGDVSFMLRQGLQEKVSAGQASVHVLNSGMSPGNFPHIKKFTSPSENNRAAVQPGATRFLREQSKDNNVSRGRTTLDPLEEKILFDTEDSGWDTSLSKLAAIDTEDFVGSLNSKVSMNAFSSIQSGSWSALMQSAVAEASSSDTGIQEELSGLSFENTESSIGKQLSNLVSNEHQTSKQVDSMQSKNPRWSDFQQLPNRPVPAGHPVNDWVGANDYRSRDLSHGSNTADFSMPNIFRNDHEFIQQTVDSDSYLPTKTNTDQEDYKSMGYDHLSCGNPMTVDALYKRAAEIQGIQNHFQTENSCDNYNSKVSQVYVAQADLPDHACVNAEDTESSERINHKSQNEASCISSPKVTNHLMSTDAIPTNANFKIKGKPKMSAEAFTKDSPASDLSASINSQDAPMYNDASQLKDHSSTEQTGQNISQIHSQELDMPVISVSVGATIPDRFSFQSSVPGDSSLLGLGNRQKGQAWWTQSSFGHSFPPFHGASLLQNFSSKTNVFRKSDVEALNVKSERNSFEGLFSGPLHMNNQLDGEHTLKVSESFGSMQKTSAMTEQMSSSGFSPTQGGYTFIDVSSSPPEYVSAGAFSVTQSDVIQGTCYQGAKLHNVWMDVPSQKDMTGLSSSIGLPSRSSVMSHDSSGDQMGKIYETVSLKGHGYGEKYPTFSTVASGYDGSSICRQGYVNNYNQSQALPNIDNVTQQEEIAGTSANEVACELSNLNKHWVPVVPAQQQLHEMNYLAHNHGCSQLNLCPSGNNMPLAFSSGGSSSMMDKPLPAAALQYKYSHKHLFDKGHFHSSNILSDRLRYFNGSAAQPLIKASENEQLNGTIAHNNGIDASRNFGLLPVVANQMVTSGQSLLSSVCSPDAKVDLNAIRTKKRKSAMYECRPWHEEVMKTCQALPNISAADHEWAEATNRLIEKFVDGGERKEDMQSSVRAKRRLIMSTKLMQLVFRPPSRTILSVDANTDHEIVSYFIAKFALADACSWANKKMDDNISHEISSTGKTDRNANHLSDKATEIIEKTKNLETHIERLSKSVSVVDVLVDCQELEKFSVINHFAKYHSRGPGSAMTDVTSSSTAVSSVRPFLQRYVSAVPLPPKLPEVVHCLSL